MALKMAEVQAKSILSKSGIPGMDYCVNPYRGCMHACRYCYAEVMHSRTGHMEPWGKFLDVKTNAPELLDKALKKAPRGRVMLSSVTDAYQSVEAKHRVTRACLQVLLDHGFPVGILTKSPLITRDLDLLTRFKDIEVGMTITTDDEAIRRAFEPGAPSIKARLMALSKLKEAGLRPYVFIGPLLPCDPERLGGLLGPLVEDVLMDRMNYYTKTVDIYRRMGLTKWLDRRFTGQAKERIAKAMQRQLKMGYLE